MKKTLLGFGAGLLAAILLVSVYAFQTENDADVVIISRETNKLKISYGTGETRVVDIGPSSKNFTGFDKQTAFVKVLQEYLSQGYSIETAIATVSDTQYILTKN